MGKPRALQTGHGNFWEGGGAREWVWDRLRKIRDGTHNAFNA